MGTVDDRGVGLQNIICDITKEQQKIKDQVLMHKTDVKKLIDSLLHDDTNKKDLGEEILVLLEGAIILSQIQKSSWPIASAKRAAIKLLE